MGTSTMVGNRKHRNLTTNVVALVTAAFLLFVQSSLAIDLGGVFGGRRANNDASADKGSTDMGQINSQIAIENAKKLVNDLNDASTGTITSYQPGREKEPVTCNDIMAKALVVANEEKAAIVEERESVVRAASLLSERNDDLEAKLQAANEAIHDLEEKLKEAEADAYERLVKAEADTDTKLKEAEVETNERIEELMKQSEVVKEEAKQKISEMELKVENTQKEAQDSIDAEIERSKANLQNMKESTATEIEAIKADCEEKISMKDAEMATLKQESEAEIEKIKAETEEKLSMKDQDIEVLKRAAESDMENMKTDCEEKLLLKDAEVKQKLDDAEDIMAQKDAFVQQKIVSSEEEIKQIKFRADASAALAQKNAEEKIASILARAEEEKLVIMESTRHDIEKKNREIVEERKRMEKEMKDLVHKSDAEIKEIHDEAEERIKQAHDEMEKAIAIAEAKIKSEKERYKKTEKALQMNMIDAHQKEESLNSDIKELQSVISSRSEEIQFWKEKHLAQGYCNTTLMREDTQKFALSAMSSARNLMQSAEGGVATQLQKMQGLVSDGMAFVENEALPKIGQEFRLALEKTEKLYDERIAPAVRENVVPVYNQHIYPFYEKKIYPTYQKNIYPVYEKNIYPVYKEQFLPAYEEHVSPALNLAKKEVDQMVKKTRNELHSAHNKAAALLKQSSSSAIKLLEEKEVDDKIPIFFMSVLTQASNDGERELNWLLKTFLVIFIYKSRFLIYRLIGVFFSITWFFCPLRLFVRKQKVVKKGTKENAKPSKEISAMKGGNGAKVKK